MRIHAQGRKPASRLREASYSPRPSTGHLARVAAAIHARGFRVGPHVTVDGEELARETHAARAADVYKPTPTLEQNLGAALEREADGAADAVIADRFFRPTWRTGLAVQRQALPAPPATLAGLTARRDAFNNTGAPDPNNCATNLPAALGVDGPAIGENGMEMIFEISGAIPPGTEFEITRTKASGLWQHNAGAWSRMGGWAAGTSDDHHDDDECLTPVGGRVFVHDIPGLEGSLNPRGVAIPGAGTVAATATRAVWKLNFAEWVIARNRQLGIGWVPISTPTLHRWHSIFSVALAGGAWTRVDTPGGQHNEIEIGGIGTTGGTP